MSYDRVTCPTCGEVHDLSEMQVAFDKPDAWFAIEPGDRESRATLTPDLAVIDGEHHFVRGVLEIPVVGEAQPFGWGIWVKVAPADFERYASSEVEDGAQVPAPFPGRIATQLAGYPQTLGIDVIVKPSGGDLRPLFDIADAAHPLALEQRDCIRVERVLEHLSRQLHFGEPEPLGRPWVATIAVDGWQLDDAVSRYQARDGVYWVPALEDRASVDVGDLVKMIFSIEASDHTGAPAIHREWMWVEVDRATGGPGPRFTGILTNDPRVPGTTRAGMRVWFGPEHVVDAERDDVQLSAKGDLLRCANHGVSQRTYVCQHVAHGRGVGFHQAEDPGNPRPDAWCDACDALLRGEGTWSDRAEEAAGITLICGACYDAAEARNRSP